MASKPQTESIDSKTLMTRRQMMKTTGAAIATAATATATMGNAAAAGGFNFETNVVQNPYLKGSVTVATHESDFDPLQFTNDSGEVVTLADYGGVIAPRVDDTTPHNPITLDASKFDAEEYRAFPRGEQYDSDSDGEADTDVSALDVTHWTADESGTAGSTTLEDVTSPADGDGLHVATSGQTSGDTAIFTFDSSFLEITSGEDRKLMQLVLDVDTLESGAVVTIRVRDEDGDVREATIDPSGDTANTGVIAASTVSGLVYQARMGELPQTNNGDGTFNNLQELEIEVKEANADISIYALNLERESEWVFGTQEYTNSDDELDEQEIVEPSGTFSITGLDTVEAPLDDAPIKDVQYDIRLKAQGLDAEHLEYEWTDAERYDYPNRLKMLLNFEEPTAYDLDWSITGLYDKPQFPSTRFIEAGVKTGQSDMVTLEDIEDDEVTLTDRTSTYADGAIDTEVELSTSIAPGDFDAVFVDILYSDDEKSTAWTAPSSSGPVEGESSGGFLDMLFTVPGMIVTAVTGYFGLSKLGVFGE